MIGEHVNPTRMELLAKRAQIALAEQGRDLLTEKRNALMKEFMNVADTVMRSSDELEQAVGAARYALALARALDGPEAVRSAAFAARGEVDVEVSGSHVMGVPVPVIERKKVSRSLLGRGYSFAGTSSRIDQAAERFEEEVELIIELADTEMRLRRLAEEIRKTVRRVNAIEHILLPELERQRRYIEMVLEERERENIFRLKRVKKTLERREQGG